MPETRRPPAELSRRRPTLAFFCLLSLLGSRPAVRADEPPGLTPPDYDNDAKLAELVWSRSGDVIDARRTAAVAASKVTRSLLYPNPALDFAWGTIPIGRTNPSDLEDPLGNVPNYSVGLSELIELGKRGPRQEAAAAEAEVHAPRPFRSRRGAFSTCSRPSGTSPPARCVRRSCAVRCARAHGFCSSTGCGPRRERSRRRTRSARRSKVPG